MQNEPRGKFDESIFSLIEGDICMGDESSEIVSGMFVDNNYTLYRANG